MDGYLNSNSRQIVNVHQLKHKIDTKITKIASMIHRLNQKESIPNRQISHKSSQTENFQISADFPKNDKNTLKKNNSQSSNTRENSAMFYGLNKESLTNIVNIIGSNISIEDQISNEQPSFTINSHNQLSTSIFKRKSSQKQQINNAIFQEVESQPDSLQEIAQVQGFTFRNKQSQIKNQQKKEVEQSSLTQIVNGVLFKQKSEKKLKVSFNNASLSKDQSCKIFRHLSYQNQSFQNEKKLEKLDGSSINKSRLSSFYQDSEKQIQKELESDRERDSFFIYKPYEYQERIEVSQQTNLKVHKMVEEMIAKTRRQPTDNTVRNNLLKRIEQRRITYKDIV